MTRCPIKGQISCWPDGPGWVLRAAPWNRVLRRRTGGLANGGEPVAIGVWGFARRVDAIARSARLGIQLVPPQQQERRAHGQD